MLGRRLRLGACCLSWRCRPDECDSAWADAVGLDGAVGQCGRAAGIGEQQGGRDDQRYGARRVMDDRGEDLGGPAGLAAPQGTVAEHASHGRAALVLLSRPDSQRQGAAGPDAGAADDRAAGAAAAPGTARWLARGSRRQRGRRCRVRRCAVHSMNCGCPSTWK